MAADLLLLATSLLALLAVRVLAQIIAVAQLQASMDSALQHPSANLAATDISKPALLVLQGLLSTHAALLDQERALDAA